MQFLKYLHKVILCKIGLHKIDMYYDKLREGDFYCTICDKDMNPDV